jgi:hypothetical protein
LNRRELRKWNIHFIAAFFHRHAGWLYGLGVIVLVALVVCLLRSRRVFREK